MVVGGYGEPPPGNANFAWIQHFIHHLKPQGGRAGFVMAKGSLTSKSANEDKIRKALVEAHLIDCIINLPAKLFLNTQIPACLWFLERGRQKKRDEILFIDSRNLGHLINRRNRELKGSDIQKISHVYDSWKRGKASYRDEPGFCSAVPVKRVRELDYILSPGRYVGLKEEEGDFDFAKRFKELKVQLEGQVKEEAFLNRRILKNLAKIHYEK